MAKHIKKRPPMSPEKREGLISVLQNCAIVLLLISAAVLVGVSGLFDSFSDAVLGMGYEQSGGTGSAYSSAAEPFTIVVTASNGAHCAVRYDTAALDEAYTALSSSLAEALGSSGEPERVTENEMLSAVGGRGVYFDFIYDQPLSLLASWLGTSVTGEAGNHTARRLCLSVGDDAVELYYLRAREDGGTPYRCVTALSAESLSGLIDGYTPNGAQFCFELDGRELVDPYFLVTPGLTTLPAASSSPAVTDGRADSLMTSLGMNAVLAESYYEADGTRVSVEGSSILRMAPDGTLGYTVSDYDTRSQALPPAEAVELALGIARSATDGLTGQAKLCLSYLGKTPETGEYIITFDYVLSGVPVSLPKGAHAVSVRLCGQTVVSAQLCVRTYETLAETLTPLPTTQQAALVQAAGGGEARLTYADDFESVRAKWLVY